MFKGLFKKAGKMVNDTKKKIDKLSESADKFISDGNNQMKIITCVIAGLGVSMIASNVVTMVTTIYSTKHTKSPKVVNNIYIYKNGEKVGCKQA